MKTFYRVTLFAFIIGLAILCCDTPWTGAQLDHSGPNGALAYAPIWSQTARAIPGARIDAPAFVILTGVVAFFAIVIGGAAFFFRDDRGSERADV